MSAILINYADRRFFRAQTLNTKTALETGGFDYAISYRRKAIDRAFAAKNRAILAASRGAGFWLWKPYIVVKTLRELSEGDVLFYCDSGAHFIADAAPAIALCRERAKGILLFSLEEEHKNRIWTKRDCFHYMELDEERYADTAQLCASFLVCERSAFALAFFEEWLALAEDGRLLTDAPNDCGLGNYPEFKDHRHDQSILSLLALKHGIVPYPDISQFGNDSRPQDMPQIIDLTRWRA